MAADVAEQKRRVLNLWNESAHAWERQFDWYATNMRPLMKWCCDATALAPGARVLDVACGTGEPAMSVARRVGPAGSVLAVDLSPEMVSATAQRARSLSLDHVECRVMDAERLDVPDNSFDAVTFSCGLMFCPEPPVAVAEIRRVLRPGGRFAIAVWDDPARNDFATVLGSAASAVLDIPPPTAGSPGPFRLAREDAFAKVLRDGGLTPFDVDTPAITLTYASIDEYLRISMDLAAGLRWRLEALSPPDFERFKERVRENAAPFVADDGTVRLRAAPLCASGQLIGATA